MDLENVLVEIETAVIIMKMSVRNQLNITGQCFLLFMYMYTIPGETPWSSGLSGSVMVQKVAMCTKHEFEAGLRYEMTRKLSLSTQQ